MIIKALKILLLLAMVIGCAPSRKGERSLPDGFYIFIANSKDRALAGPDDVHLVRPMLQSVGVTESFIVTFSAPAEAGAFVQDELVGFTLISRKSKRVVATGLSKSQMARALREHGEVAPAMYELNEYKVRR